MRKTVKFLHRTCLIEFLPENNLNYTHIHIGTFTCTYAHIYTQVFCFQLLTHDSINHQLLGAKLCYCGKYVLALSLMVGSVINTLFYCHIDAINEGVSTHQ